uniref:Uncharacterized protein n=1 Tax=Cannabis sativa TaxID=3483 RepID=A0A803QK99_CANSA
MRAQQATIDNHSRQATVLIRRSYQVTGQQPRVDTYIPTELQYELEEHLAGHTQKTQVNESSNPLSHGQRGLDGQNIPPIVQPNNTDNYVPDHVLRGPHVTQVGQQEGQVNPLVQAQIDQLKSLV